MHFESYKQPIKLRNEGNNPEDFDGPLIDLFGLKKPLDFKTLKP